MAHSMQVKLQLEYPYLKNGVSFFPSCKSMTDFNPSIVQHIIILLHPPCLSKGRGLIILTPFLFCFDCFKLNHFNILTAQLLKSFFPVKSKFESVFLGLICS